MTDTHRARAARPRAPLAARLHWDASRLPGAGWLLDSDFSGLAPL